MYIYIVDHWKQFSFFERECYANRGAALESFENPPTGTETSLMCELNFGSSKVQTVAAMNLILERRWLTEGEHQDGDVRESVWAKEERKARGPWRAAGCPPRGVSLPPHPTVSNLDRTHAGTCTEQHPGQAHIAWARG